MSSFNNLRDARSHRSRRWLTIAAVCATLALGGCFRPMYGPSASGADVASRLASVDVVIVPRTGQERLSHYLDQELRFALDGSGRPVTKAYRLELSLSQDVVTSSINQATGQAVAAIVRLTASYKLVDAAGGQVLTSGSATASAGYDRTPQRFSNLRAARDAELRGSKVLAEQLQTRMAGWFAGRR